jgi:hypothetical protein
MAQKIASFAAVSKEGQTNKEKERERVNESQRGRERE